MRPGWQIRGENRAFSMICKPRSKTSRTGKQAIHLAGSAVESRQRLLQRLLGTGGKTRQICTCQQFCVQAHIARSSTPETAMSRLMCISNGIEARPNTGLNLSAWRPAVVSRGELMDIYRLISEQQAALLEKWHDYFGD
jgi:hypothetical protein